ncbi:MAG: hypothetical protein Q9M89_10170 [Persephonella sp.]|nr:hypothetical protein [Persephonella sp.]
MKTLLLTTKKKIENIIKGKKKISVEDSIYIFDRFSVCLKKVTDLIKKFIRDIRQ